MAAADARTTGLLDAECLERWLDGEGLPGAGEQLDDPKMAAFGDVVLDMARRAAELAGTSKL